MVRKYRKLLSVAALLAVIVAVLPVLHAQPPAEHVLAGIESRDNGACLLLDVRFLRPVGYLSHFPGQHGKRLRIDVQLMADTVGLESGFREAVHQQDARIGMTRVTFESGTFGRGELYVEFDEDRTFSVRQGQDGRSIVLMFPYDTDNAACIGEQAKD